MQFVLEGAKVEEPVPKSADDPRGQNISAKNLFFLETFNLNPLVHNSQLIS